MECRADSTSHHHVRQGGTAGQADHPTLALWRRAGTPSGEVPLEGDWERFALSAYMGDDETHPCCT
jgi:hypothetical protein